MAQAQESAPTKKKPVRKKENRTPESVRLKSDGHSGKSKEEKQRLKAKKRRKRLILRIVGRTSLFLFTVLIMAVLGAYAMLNVIFRGHSQTAGDILTISLLESSAGKFVPYLFYSEEEVDAILARNKVVELVEETDTSLVVINIEPATETDEAGQPVEDIAIEEITGATYHGWMMIVRDPSRVSVGVSADYFTEDKGGLHLSDMAEKYEAIAAINGGAFYDHAGQGNGGTPEGVTISQGVLTNAHGGTDLTTVGFDENDVLVVGKFTRSEAMERGVRDAVSFGPALIVNGEPAQVSGVSSGLNPRTAIGQRADGAVLMLVIDGRQVNSLGASIADLVDIMVRYGAVNACNLDGGSSSNLYYNGEILNRGVAITGSRRIPTAFVVR